MGWVPALENIGGEHRGGAFGEGLGNEIEHRGGENSFPPYWPKYLSEFTESSYILAAFRVCFPFSSYVYVFF